MWAIVAGGYSTRREREDYREIGAIKTRPGTNLVEGGVGDRANWKSEPRTLFSQELGSGGVESDDSISETNPSTNLVDSGTIREHANHEDEERHVEKEEKDNRDEVSPQGRQAGRGGQSDQARFLVKECSQEDEGEDEPGSQKDPDGGVQLPRVLGVGI